MTFCGKSDASNLRMENVPWHYEVCAFAESMVAKINENLEGVQYGIATEHEHSCCILLARKDKYFKDEKWHTWIDYPKYNELIRKYYATEGEFKFTSTDYMCPTPDWAMYQSKEKGFDPIDKRYRKTKAGAEVEIAYKPSGSGCG